MICMRPWYIQVCLFLIAFSSISCHEEHEDEEHETTTSDEESDFHIFVPENFSSNFHITLKISNQDKSFNSNLKNSSGRKNFLCQIIHQEVVKENASSYDNDEHGHEHSEENQKNPHKWIYATLAVIIISLCGLFSVAVIPIMQKWFYHALLQFLVGLAIGSLSGDALLHLMPHAIIGHGDHDHHGHDDHEEVEEQERTKNVAIFRGLAALGGIFFFFITERVLEALTSYRKKKKDIKADKPSENLIPNKINDDAEKNIKIGKKLSHYKNNSTDSEEERNGKESTKMLPQHHVCSRKDSTNSSHEVAFHGRSSFCLDAGSSVLNNPSAREVIVSEHHGHEHGHAHVVPQSVSAVAWMVIMGDGLHNFCDGLAIGAAFASSIGGGISTTVAVFCHELPHELGDFAMLLKTGMKVKQALFYNGLSSVLCFIGMIIGVTLGNVESAADWVFSVTVGMFIYIALVDMLPELSDTISEPGSTAIYTLLIQIVGISIGISIMLLIALYEEDLENIANK